MGHLAARRHPGLAPRPPRRSSLLGAPTAVSLAVALLAAAGGCDETDAHLPAQGAPPVSGGTLELADVDGRRLAVASDPARSSVYIVDIGSRSERHRVVLPDAEPGRIAIDGDRAYVALRASGEIATLALRTGEVLERRAACEAPRGIDLDPASGDLWVACAEGVLVRLPPADGGVSQRVPVGQSDLRDVIARPDGELWVSRFRAAEVLVIRDGEVTVHAIPDQDPLGDLRDELDLGRDAPPAFEANVAWRMREADDGRVLLVHQLSQSTPIGSSVPTPGDAPPADVSYGGGGGPTQCESLGVLRTAVSFFDGERFDTVLAGGTSLAVDAAVDGSALALAAAAEPMAPTDTDQGPVGSSGLRVLDLEPGPRTVDDAERTTCRPTREQLARGRPAVAVASLGDGHFVAQYPDPGELRFGFVQPSSGEFFFEEPEPLVGPPVALSGGRIDDAGRALFHEATPSGAACASCHPEGGDDGHTWRFTFGPRRSQTLRGGILDTAPFHWNGEHRDLAAVFDDTFVQRMGGGTAPRGHEIESFEQWIDRVPAAPGAVAEAERIDRGRQVFRDAGCDSCHGVEAVQAGVSASIVVDEEVPLAERTLEFQAPRLHDMLYRGPYLHDGSAQTLEDAVDAMPEADAIPADAKADLIAYLRSI